MYTAADRGTLHVLRYPFNKAFLRRLAPGISCLFVCKSWHDHAKPILFRSACVSLTFVPRADHHLFYAKQSYKSIRFMLVKMPEGTIPASIIRNWNFTSLLEDLDNLQILRFRRPPRDQSYIPVTAVQSFARSVIRRSEQQESPAENRRSPLANLWPLEYLKWDQLRGLMYQRRCLNGLPNPLKVAMLATVTLACYPAVKVFVAVIDLNADLMMLILLGTKDGEKRRSVTVRLEELRRIVEEE
jgi:hypothetical protein